MSSHTNLTHHHSLTFIKLPVATLLLAFTTSFGFAAGATALGSTTAGTTTTTSSDTTSSSSSKTTSPAVLSDIISRGNTEINRRLTVLNTLGSKITSATKLTTSDSSTLTTEVTSEISGLTTLKTQLDADTTVAAAKTDAESIFTGYRVYALVVPQVDLVKTADDQQAAETKLSTLATAMQTHITSTTPASVQTDLTNMNSEISAAQTISSTIETTVIALQPSDYNTNHAVLGGDLGQLTTAQKDIKTAEGDAQTIINSLQSTKAGD